MAADRRTAHRRERDDAALVLLHDDVVDVLVARQYEPQLQPPRLALAMGREAARHEAARRFVQRRRHVVPALVVDHGASVARRHGREGARA